MRVLVVFSLGLLLCLVHSQTVPYVSFMSQTLANNSYVDLSLVGRPDIGGGDDVQCITDLNTCCRGTDGVHRGDWYFPDGTRLPFSSSTIDTFENRETQGVDIRRNSDVNSPTVGIYRCDIPTNAVHDATDISVRDTVYVGLYNASGGNVTISGSIVLTVDSDLNGASPQFTLTCISTGGPATTVTWTRDSTTVTQGTQTVLNDPVTAQYTHTLTVTGRLPGIYTCTVANNKPSSASESISIEVTSAPTDLAARRPSSTSIEVTWTPPPLGDATNGYIIYYTNTLSGSTDSVNITGRSTNNYTLTGVSPNEEYNISIVATSQHLFSDPVSIFVAVFLGQPFFQTLSADKTTITLSWAVPSGSVVTSYVVMWERNSSMGCPYKDEGSMTISTSDESYNTTISGVQEDSEYFVSVTAVNSDGNTTSNIATVSTDEDIPSGAPMDVALTDVTSTSVSFQWGSVECIHRNGLITGYSVNYRRQGSSGSTSVLVTVNSPSDGGTYTIVDLEPSEMYDVEITAQTTIGTALDTSGFTTLTHVGVPVLSVGSLTSVSVDLQWTSSGQQQVTYEISIQRDTSIGCPFEDNRNLTVTNGLTAAQVAGLQEDSRYWFTVTASNPADSSEVSNTLSAMTEKAAPSASPTSVVASEIGPLKIRVVWGPVECIHSNGAITSYQVCHTNLDTLSEICAPSSADGATSLDISVSSAALYSVRVAAVNDVGEGPFSNEVQIEVVAPVPGAPKDVQVVEPIGQRVVEIQWSDPVSPAPVVGYNLACTPTPTSPPPTFSDPPVATYTLTGLAPATDYSCSLVAFNDVGSGPSVTISFTTLPDYGSLEIQLSGLIECSEWLGFSTSQKIQDVSDTINEQLNTLCPQCQLSGQDISNATLECISESPNSVIFSAVISGTADKDSGDLLEELSAWISTSPSIRVVGVMMGVGEQCSSVVSDLSGNICDSPSEPPTQPPTATEANRGASCNVSETTVSSGSLGQSVGVGIVAGLAVLLVAGAAFFIPFCIMKHRRRMQSYLIKKGDMDTSSNMAYGMTVINRAASINDSTDHDYDVVNNRRPQDTPPTLPRRDLPAGQGGNTGYEVSTPTNIRQMRVQRSSQNEEDLQEEEKELYSQISTNM